VSVASTVRPVIVSTDGLAPERQFEAWRDTCVPYLDTGRPHTHPKAGFAARGMALPFGPFMYYRAVLQPYDYSRTARRIRRDSLDHWIIAVCVRGRQRQRSGDTEIELRTGLPYVLSMASPFEAMREGAEIEWHSLFIARDAISELEPLLSATLYSPLDSAMGGMLACYLRSLDDVILDLPSRDIPHLASVTTAMVAAALGSGIARDDASRPHVEHLQLARMRRLIRENLGSATLGPNRLCALGGISRSALYRLFEPLGGVARHIQRERLSRAYRLLTDPAERRGIGEIAESVGFFEPSTFSRSFRAEFGLSPRDARVAALTGQAPMPPRRDDAMPAARTGVAEILRGL